AKSVVLSEKEPGRGWRIAATAVGLFVLIFGAADVMTRIAHATLGPNASLYTFGSVAMLDAMPASNPASTAPAAVIKPAATSTKEAFVPMRLQIPSIGVNAAVEQVSKKDDGSMGTPTKFGDVAWYSPGPKPGQPGNAVIDGHVNNALTTSGVFQHLSQIALGDTVTVVSASGTQMNFTVSSIQEYPADSAPEASIFAVSGTPGVVLITCDGQWVPSAKSFDKRLVVFATLK
ncbi:MAG TPA: class F sortase, partial [Candidatus Paceibacterota bacterium]|nr:class F sortase [Candidatus Paceibacterota bacterium]